MVMKLNWTVASLYTLSGREHSSEVHLDEPAEPKASSTLPGGKSMNEGFTMISIAFVSIKATSQAHRRPFPAFIDTWTLTNLRPNK